MRDKLILVSFGAALLVNILIWILTLSKFGTGSARVPLHFSIVYGINFLGPARQIYLLPLAGLLFILVNAGLARMLYDREKLLAYFLAVGSTVAQVILCLAALSLLAVNV